MMEYDWFDHIVKLSVFTAMITMSFERLVEVADIRPRSGERSYPISM